MKRIVFGDVHGAAYELEGLLHRMTLGERGYEVWSVGDLFDRGLHAAKVWHLIEEYGIKSVLGNHERKMLKFLQGEIDSLPLHYYVAFDDLDSAGVLPEVLEAYIAGMPLLVDFGEYIITHGGVLIDFPSVPDISANVYGNLESAKRMPRPEVDGHPDGQSYWWDEYKGSKVIIYGHLVTGDNNPRIRYIDGKINSIGLDGAAVHGGNMLGVKIDDSGVFECFSFSSGRDWFKECKTKIGQGKWDLNTRYAEYAKRAREGRKLIT